MFLNNIYFWNRDDDFCHDITVTSVFCPYSSVWPWSVAVTRETCHGGTGLSGGGLWGAHQTQETDQPGQELPKPSGPPPRAAHEPEEVRGHKNTSVLLQMFPDHPFCWSWRRLVYFNFQWRISRHQPCCSLLIGLIVSMQPALVLLHCVT